MQETPLSRMAARSSSAPAVPLNDRRIVSDDELHEFPALLNVEVQDADVGSWVQDLATSRLGRQSRASSIVSTRTRFSTTTLDEVRSIEISAGSHSFRISRDGSRIIDTTSPPPYTGAIFEANPGLNTEVNDEDAGDHDRTWNRHHSPQGDREPRKRVRIVMPGEDDDDEATGSRHEERSPDRVLTKADLYQIMVDLPNQLKRVLGIRMPISKQISASAPDEQSVSRAVSSSIQRNDSTSSTHIRRDSGIGCSSSVTDLRTADKLPTSFKYDNKGKEMQGGQNPNSDLSNDSGEELDTVSSTETLRPVTSEEGSLNVLMTVGDLNELSLLYNRVIRDLDREHRKVLHERDKEMEQLRSLLNEKDIVYRQQLKGKDFIIEDFKKRLDHQQESVERKIEQARNEVEDMWEKRWKDRDRHLMERMKRMELEAMVPVVDVDENDDLSEQEE